MALGFLLVFVAAISAAIASIARRKRRSAAAWFAACFLLFYVSFVLIPVLGVAALIAAFTVALVIPKARPRVAGASRR